MFHLRSHPRNAPLIAASLTLTLSLSTSAQQSPQPRPTAPNAAQAAPATDGIAQAMRRNGGSLLRATLAQPANAVPGTVVSQTSFYAVPVPQPKMVKKHDLITIIVREESQSKSEGTTDLKKEAALNAKIEQFVRLNLNKMALQNTVGGVAPEIKMSADRSFKTDGSVDRSDSVTFRVTAEVIDVKPNGTLVLQARKRLKTDEEEEFVVLSGACRAEDIAADNTLLSTQLMDFDMIRNHKGAVRDANTRGWVPRLLDALNPF